MTIQDQALPEPQLGIDVIGFGAGEFAYILNVFEGPSRDRSVSVFRATEVINDVPLATAGASALMARDLATVNEKGELGVKGVAAAVATAVGHATRWTEISLLTSDSMDNIVLIEAPEVALMLQPRLLGTWFIFAQDPTISSAEATLRLIQQHVAENSGGSAYLIFKTLTTEQHLLVRSEGTKWVTGIPDFATDQVAESPDLDNTELLATITNNRG